MFLIQNNCKPPPTTHTLAVAKCYKHEKLVIRLAISKHENNLHVKISKFLRISEFIPFHQVDNYRYFEDFLLIIKSLPDDKILD